MICSSLNRLLFIFCSFSQAELQLSHVSLLGVRPKRFILLGDFNDNPDDKSLNILETGSIDAQGGAEGDDGASLSNPGEDLVALDKVSHGKSAADINPQTGRIDLVTAGSRARNNNNRGNDTNTG